MKKITELSELKELYRVEKDEFGKRTKVPYTKMARHELIVVKGWARFGHYLIDGVVIYAIGFIAGIIMALLNISIVFNMSMIEERLFGMLIVLVYYLVCESLFQRTIGKLATQSIVVNEYGQKPTFGATLGRSFARLVPFEAFSCFGERGWHDTWSKTFVITKKELGIIQRLQKEDGGYFVDDVPDILD